MGHDESSMLDALLEEAGSVHDKAAAISRFNDHLERTPRFMEHRLPSGGWDRSSSGSEASTGGEHAFMVCCMAVSLLALAGTQLWPRIALLVVCLAGKSGRRGPCTWYCMHTCLVRLCSFWPVGMPGDADP